MSPQSLAYVAALASLATAQTIQFDGRVPADTELADFDAANDLFGNENVLGEGLKFSDLLLLPNVDPSLFDVDNTVPLEVTIRSVSKIQARVGDEILMRRTNSDDSIFNGQTGFRRAELNPASNDGADPSTEGVKTVHFSLMKDSERALNLSHEYQLFFLESACVS